MTAQTFTTGQILTAAEMNALSTQAAGALQAPNNLSDVASAASARSNLGAGTGNGTVTSIALAVPADFTVSGSPVTNAGTLTLAHANQSANTVQSGPSSGAAAAPSYRALVAADLPTVGASLTFRTGRFYTANGVDVVAANSTFVTRSLITGLPIFIPNQITLQTLSCQTAGTVSGTAHARMALYADAGGLPGAPVAGADSGDLTQTAAGVLTSGTLGVVLLPGWYWPVWESSGLAGGTLYVATQARMALSNGTGANDASDAITRGVWGVLAAHTYATALPNPWVTSSENSTSTFVPIIALGT